MNARRLATGRLVLVSATSQHLLVEQRDVTKLGGLLAADIPAGWPPDGCSDKELLQMNQRLSVAPGELLWRRRYIVLKKTGQGRPLLVGHLRIAGPPRFGTVHIEQIALVDEHRGQGIEREALAVVIDWVMEQPGVKRITAEQPEEAGEALGVWSDLRFVADDETGRMVRTAEAWQADGPSTPRQLKPRPAGDAIEGIPTMAVEIFERLMKEPLRDPEDMRRECALYVGMIETAAESNPYVDNELGREIARICDALLADIDAGTPEHTRRQIQAAARYFVTEEDGDSDLAIGGLDEDAAVANAVAEHLGRGDLVTDFP
ncbi:MAG: GNAT family N-acetyltransferase [Myxococcota bacterium]